MQPRHGFRCGNETDPNEPKHHYWVQKSELGAFVSFLTDLVHRFVSDQNRCIKCNPRHGLRCSNETDPNEPKHHYWVQKSELGEFVSFHFWMIPCIVSFPTRIGALNATPAWFSVQ